MIRVFLRRTFPEHSLSTRKGNGYSRSDCRLPPHEEHPKRFNRQAVHPEGRQDPGNRCRLWLPGGYLQDSQCRFSRRSHCGRGRFEGALETRAWRNPCPGHQLRERIVPPCLFRGGLSTDQLRIGLRFPSIVGLRSYRWNQGISQG